MNICVIPARGGSKRIPRKNIKLFKGRPVIAYAIDAAKETNLFKHVLVSSDDEEIAEIAAKLGAETLYPRPAYLSSDTTPTAPVIEHAISSCIDLYGTPNYVCCIYPATPLIAEKDISGAFKFMLSCGADSCVPVTAFNSAPQRALQLNAENKLEHMYPEFAMTRSQDLRQAYYDVGQFYWGTPKSWSGNEIINGVPYIIPKWRIVDIDDCDDWKRAELYFDLIRQNQD